MLLTDIAAPSPSTSPTSLIGHGDPWSRSDWLALVQVATGVIAIAISVAAFFVANRQGQIAERNVFQRTVLLDLAKLLDDGIPDKDVAATRIALLPSASLGFWRVYLKWRFEVGGDERIRKALDLMGVPEAPTDVDRILLGLRESLRSEAARAGHETSKMSFARDEPEIWAFYE